MANVRPTKELLKSFEEYMHTVQWDKSPEALYQPVDYMLSLGGKRIRPLIVLFVTDVLGGNADAALHVGYGIELFHNFTLIHDDIMDESVLRRSKESVHRKFGLNAAILSGDVMMIESMNYFIKSEHLTGVTGIQDLFIQTAREVCEGQSMDMEFETKIEISYEDYMKMIRLKTAVLLAFGFKCAAMLSGRTDLADSFYQLGIDGGLAFQIEDDWLDYYSDEQVFGKRKGGDIINAKKSALILELKECMDAKEKNEFINWYHNEQNEERRLSKMNRYLEDYSIKEKLKTRINQYQRKTFDCIEKLDLTLEKRMMVKEFLEGIFMRTW